MIDYNVKYRIHMEDERVLPIEFTKWILGIGEEIRKYYRYRPEFMSFYSIIEENGISRNKDVRVIKMRHLLHDYRFTAKNWKKKLEQDCSKVDKMLKQYGNKISDRRFHSFETGLSIGSYTGRHNIEELSIGVEAKYCHSGGYFIPEMFVEGRTLSGKKKEANRVCKSLLEIIKESIEKPHIVIEEDIERF